MISPDQNYTSAAESAEDILVAQAEAGSHPPVQVSNPAPATSHRVMTMTPLEPREMNGLRGFGFSIKFEDR